MKSVVSKVVDSKPIKMVSVLIVVEFAVRLQIREIRCYLMTESCTLFLSYFQRLWSFLNYTTSTGFVNTSARLFRREPSCFRGMPVICPRFDGLIAELSGLIGVRSEDR